MSVVNATKKMLTVFTYFAFILFPIIFANNVYKSFAVEDGVSLEKQIIENKANKALLDPNFEIQNKNEKDQSNPFCVVSIEMLLKVGAALMLSAVITNKNMVRIGVI